MIRNLATACAMLATSWLAFGCNSTDTSTPSETKSTDSEIGKIGLALSAVSSSGVEYRLRTGDISVYGWPDDCYYDGSDCEVYEQTVSTEDYLDAPTIELDMLRGSYDIYLNSGWQLERVVDGAGEIVEAQLLNGPYQFAWVQPYMTSWVTFQFGVGDEQLWFTGQLDINMEVYEDPQEYYGGDCSYFDDGEVCWEECCTDYCDPYGGCWGECWGQEIACDQIPDGGSPNQGTGGAPPR